jgi:predicted CopG family antitoxin
MRTTISIPDDVYSEAKALAGARPFSEFASKAIEARVAQLKRRSLAVEMEAGYRAEKEASSLDEAWSAVETEGLL